VGSSAYQRLHKAAEPAAAAADKLPATAGKKGALATAPSASALKGRAGARDGSFQN